MKETKRSKFLNALDKGQVATTITICNKNMYKLETIGWNAVDNGYKHEFISNNYDEDLVNKNAPFISIVSWEVY